MLKSFALCDIFILFLCEVNMEVLDEERTKLAIIQQQYRDLISYYNEKIKSITKDYKNDPFMQATLLEQCTNKLQLLERTINTPFFGRIDFLHDEDKKETICYIGKVGVLDYNGNPITVDWRAPIASLYYDSNIGYAKYLAPDGLMTGYLNLKRQFDIEDGILKSFQDVNTVANDELLKPYLSTSADNRLKNIVATIQSEQNAIIRKSIYTNNIIQGTAGSGKTTVALHRISYLIYNEQKNFRENQFMVIGPNAYFMDYISSVLPDLDVHSVKETTFLNIVNDYLGEKIKIVDQNARLENILNHGKVDPNIPYKSSLKYKRALDLFIKELEENMIHGPIVIDHIVLFSEDDMLRFFAKKTLGIAERIKEFMKYAKKSLKEREGAIKDAYWRQFRDEFLSLPLDSPRREEILLNTEKFNKDFSRNTLQVLNDYFSYFSVKTLEFYKRFIENIGQYILNDECDLQSLKMDTLNAIHKKTLGYEDLPALIYLHLKLNGYKGYDEYIHVVLDEAQDYGLFHFLVLKELFKNSTFSIFGDLAQSIYSYQSIHDWESVIQEVFDEKTELLKLEKSYRTTYEIMASANLVSKWFGFGDAKAVLRHGKNVEVDQVDDSKIVEYIEKRIDTFLGEGYKSIAIICKDEAEVKKIAKRFIENNLVYHIIGAKNTKYDGGICFVSSYLAKGLEFDAVIIYNVEQYDVKSELDMKLLYVAMTRALHELYITYQRDVIYPLRNLKK